MMKVVCFYWHGDRWNLKVGENPTDHLKRVGGITLDLASQYVNNLYYGVKSFMPYNFQFICFTNEKLKTNKEIEIRKFPVIGKGVLPRLFMFSEKSGLFGHQVLSLDLDIVITGSLDDIAGYNGMFCTRKSYMNSEKGLLDGDIMNFYACRENEDKFWKPFINNVEKSEEITNGRERYWVRHVTNNNADSFDELAPNQILSYKRNVKGKGLPENARIVSFHGHPRPHQANDNWIKQYWQYGL